MNVPLMQPVLNDEMLHCAVDALKNERFLRGKSVEEFEDQFAEYIGRKQALAVNSGTSALHLSLIAMGVKKGDYVATTPATFIATANAITYLNAKPVFVDISLDTYTLDPEKLERCIKKHDGKVKVVMPVHLYGYPCEMDEISAISEKYKVKILEDACQAHGATYKNRKAGSFGDAAAFSFYPSKNMTVCGDGGMVVTDDIELAEKIRSLREVGRSNDPNVSYLHTCIGYSARMNTVNAAIGKIQLKYLENWNEKRRKAAEKYSENLEDVGDIILPPSTGEHATVDPVWHLYVIRTKYRDSLKSHLEKNGIQCGIHYPIPVHLQPPYRNLGFTKGTCPNAEKWAQQVLSLPMYPNLSEEEIEYVVANVKAFYEQRAV